MDRVMTRRGAARMEESKLQLTLQELNKYKNLCEELQREQDDNEKEVLQILNNNSKLKGEMAELHCQLVNVTEERDKLKLLVDRFDQCSDEFDLTLRHNAELKSRLSVAQDTILALDTAGQRTQTEHTHALFDKLVGSAPSANSLLGSNDRNSCKQNEIIDLTCDNSLTSMSHITQIKCSKNKLKKYIKIKKLIKKTQKLINKNKNHFNNNLRKINKCNLIKTNYENTKIKYEADIQHLQSEILRLQDSLSTISEKYTTSQKEIGEYILAMNGLVDLCSENERMYNSLVNSQTPDCKSGQPDRSQPAISLECLTPNTHPVELCNSLPSTSFITQINCNNNICTNSDNKIMMFCDEIGQNMSHKLYEHVGAQVINCCMPAADYKQIMNKILTGNYSPSTTIIVLIGRRGNTSVNMLMKYSDNLIKLNVKKIVLYAFPYGQGLSQTEKNIRNKCNMKLHTLSLYNKQFEFIDTNVIISNNYFRTKDNYYLSNYYKGQVAISLSYCILNKANCLAKHTAPIEHIDCSLVDTTLEFVPSNLN